MNAHTRKPNSHYDLHEVNLLIRSALQDMEREIRSDPFVGHSFALVGDRAFL